MEQANKYQIPNLNKACEVMKLLALHPDGMSFKSIKDTTFIPHTTLIRILKTLQNQHFVRDDESGRFHLGSELHRIGGLSLRNLDVRAEALPFLKQLAEEIRATSHLATFAGDKSLIVAVEDSPEPLKVASEPGALYELHSTSTGKCFLAHSVDDPEQYLESVELKPKTDRTLTDIDSIIAEVEQVREQGYSIEDQEHLEGVRSCSAPVFDNKGDAVGAIGVAAPETIFPEQMDQLVGKAVKKAAKKLSIQLGYSH